MTVTTTYTKKLTDPQPASGGGLLVTDTNYDATGSVNHATSPYAGAGTFGTLYTPVTSIPGEVDTDFDGAGRSLDTIQKASGTEEWRTTYAYPGTNEVDVTPPSGGTPTTTMTDSLGRTLTSTEFMGATVGSGTAESTTYGYDSRSDMTSMTNPAGSAWTWSFNLLGEQTSASDPDTGTTTSTYYDDGDLKTTTDNIGTTNGGNSIFYHYDILDRKDAEYSETATTTDTGGVEVAAWTYDHPASGSPVVYGQLFTSTSYVGGTAGVANSGTPYIESVANYTADYQPTATSIQLPAGALGSGYAGATYTTQYGYFPDDSVQTTTDPAEGNLAAETITNSVTNLGDLNYIYGSPVGGSPLFYVKADTYAYDHHLAEQVQGSGSGLLGRTFTWDLANDRLNEELDQNNNVTNYNVADTHYHYLNDGNIDSIDTTADTVAEDKQCFSYDGAQNLKEAWTPTSHDCTIAQSSGALSGPAPYWASYVVDVARGGNRSSVIRHATSMSGTDTRDTFTYPGAGTHPTSTGRGGPNAVTSIQHATKPASGSTWTNTTSDPYSYDLDGSTTGLPGDTVHYNALEQADTTSTSAGTQINVYDADGNLLVQTDPSTGARAYLGDTMLTVPPTGGTGTAVRTYSSGGTPVAERTSPTSVKWLIGNQQNTASVEVDSTTGAITRRYFDPFGNLRSGATGWSSPNQFLNHPVDSFTTNSAANLAQLGARSYDSTLGRFLTVDPLLTQEDPESVNGYSYSDNDPVNQSDGSGLMTALPAEDGGGCVRTCQQASSGKRAGSDQNGDGSGGGSALYVAITPHVAVASDDAGGIGASYWGWRTSGKGWGPSVDETTSPLLYASQEMNSWEQWCIATPSLCDGALAKEINFLTRAATADGEGWDDGYGATGYLSGKVLAIDDPSAFGNASTTLANDGLIDPNSIRFSQDDISPEFGDGTKIHDLAKGLADGTIDPALIPPIRLVQRAGQVYSIDNRRLWAFQKAGVDIPYRLATQREAGKAQKRGKFSTDNDGESIEIRGGGGGGGGDG